MISPTPSRGLRVGAIALGVGVLASVGVAGIANAAPVPHGDSDVDVSVTIDDTGSTGALSLSVTGTSSVLTENGSTATERVFTGTLPSVTVTDTRDSIADGAYWYVLGSITDFAGTAGQPAIDSSDSFGWAPELISGDAGAIAVGDAVAPGAGFVDPELFATPWSSQDAATAGAWSANAGLTLKTGADVAPGSYSAKLTLSLFEE